MIEQSSAIVGKWERRPALRSLSVRWPRTVVAFFLMAVTALIFGRMIAHGRAGLVAMAALLLPAALIATIRPLRCITFGIALITIVPFTLALGTAQASVPRVAAVAALAPVVFKRRGAAVLRLSIVDLAVIGIVLAVFVSWAFGPHEPHSLRPAANYVLPLAFYPAARRYGRDHGALFLWVLLIGGALASISVWFEALVWHRPLFVDPNTYVWSGSSTTVFRPSGVFESPPGASAVLAMTSLAGLPLFATTLGLKRVTVLLCLASSIGAIMFTFTRGGMIAIAIGFALYAALMGPTSWAKLIYSMMIVLLVGIVLVLPRVTDAGWYQKGVLRAGTFSQRQTFWANAWPVITDSPQHLTVGHGINSLVVGGPELPGQQAPDIAASPTLSTFSPHNQYIRTLVEEGVIGLGLILAWLLGALLKGLASVWSGGPLRRNIAAATGAITSFVVISFVDDTLRHPPGFAVVALLSGLVIAWTDRTVGGGISGLAPERIG